MNEWVCYVCALNGPAAVRQGLAETPWSRLVAGLVLGSEAFVARLRREVKGNRQEQTALRKLAARANWSQIVGVVEQHKGEPWAHFQRRHADWGRDAVLWLGRKVGRLSLCALGKEVSLEYPAVSQAVIRFERRITKDEALRRQVDKMKDQLLKI